MTTTEQNADTATVSGTPADAADANAAAAAQLADLARTVLIRALAANALAQRSAAEPQP